MLIVAFNSLHAQLPPMAGTSWKGTLYIPTPETCALKFGTDTLGLIYFEDRSITKMDARGNPQDITVHDSMTVEQMNYKLRGDTLFIKKINGRSPCDGQPGQYKLTILNDKMTFTAISDPCEPRIDAFKGELIKAQ